MDICSSITSTEQSGLLQRLFALLFNSDVTHNFSQSIFFQFQISFELHSMLRTSISNFFLNRPFVNIDLSRWRLLFSLRALLINSLNVQRLIIYTFEDLLPSRRSLIFLRLVSCRLWSLLLKQIYNNFVVFLRVDFYSVV